MIRKLHDHPLRYVTTSELADYWKVSRKQVYKQIGAGTLKAVRFGPRLFRVSAEDAIEFERLAEMSSDADHASTPSDARTRTGDDRPGQHGSARPLLRRR
jgi:excisionase family DNA binding protein